MYGDQRVSATAEHRDHDPFRNEEALIMNDWEVLFWLVMSGIVCLIIGSLIKRMGGGR